MDRWMKTALILLAGATMLAVGCDEEQIAYTVQDAALDWLADAVRAVLDGLSGL